MVSNGRKRPRVKEIKSFAETYDLDGTVVFVRCFEERGAGGHRYEVSLQAEGEAALVDVSGLDQGALPERIGAAVLAFAESIRLRTRTRG